MGRKEREEIKHINYETYVFFETLENLKKERNQLYFLYKKGLISLAELSERREKIDRGIYFTESLILEKSDNCAKKEIKKRVKISDHALLRYLERVEGIDMGEVTDKILTEDLRKKISYFGDGSYHVAEGKFKVVVQDDVIITVISNEEKK